MTNQIWSARLFALICLNVCISVMCKHSTLYSVHKLNDLALIRMDDGNAENPNYYYKAAVRSAEEEENSVSDEYYLVMYTITIYRIIRHQHF